MSPFIPGLHIVHFIIEERTDSLWIDFIRRTRYIFSEEGIYMLHTELRLAKLRHSYHGNKGAIADVEQIFLDNLPWSLKGEIRDKAFKISSGRAN